MLWIVLGLFVRLYCVFMLILSLFVSIKVLFFVNIYVNFLKDVYKIDIKLLFIV